jgi:ribosomal protein S18 acetylase RimI-like enzyme
MLAASRSHPRFAATFERMATVDIRPFEDPDAATIARLSTTVQWPSLTNAEVVLEVCNAPGAVAYVALSDDRLVGWAQAVGDGLLQSHLSFLAVHPDHRRRGIGRLLVMATFQATGTKRMDLVTDEDAGAFYERFAHKAMVGYRLYPGAQDEPAGGR